MLPQRESLPAVTVAGVIAVLLASLGILGCGLVMISMLLLPQLPSSPNAQPMPEGFRWIAIAMYGFFLAICVGELVIAINVLRRRNWARIAMLVWGASMAVLCVFGGIAVIFVFSALPQTLPDAKNNEAILFFIKAFVLILYGVPSAIGVWWLILFTRPRVVAAFQNESALASTPLVADSSGFPLAASSGTAVSAPPRKPSVPLPIAIIAGFDLSGAVWMLLMIFLPLPFLPRFFLFGVEIPGVPYKLFLAVLSVGYVVFILGIFKLKRWGLDSLLLVKSLFLISGLVTLLNPRFMESMYEVMAKAIPANPAFPNGNPFGSHAFLQGILIFSFVFGLALVGVMLFYRARFLKAAEEAAH